MNWYFIIMFGLAILATYTLAKLFPDHDEQGREILEWERNRRKKK